LSFGSFQFFFRHARKRLALCLRSVGFVRLTIKTLRRFRRDLSCLESSCGEFTMNTDNDLIWGFAIDASEGKWEITSLAPVSARSLGVALEPLKTAEKSEEVRQQPVGGFDPGFRHRQP
jgi:hypothetical protein